MSFYIGQVFDGEYPVEAAEWCNQNGAYINVVDGKYTIIQIPSPTQQDYFAQLRSIRDTKIATTDYLAMPDYPLSDEDKVAVLAYRTALRDLPAQPGAPWDGGGKETPWPDMPAVLGVNK